MNSAKKEVRFKAPAYLVNENHFFRIKGSCFNLRSSKRRKPCRKDIDVQGLKLAIHEEFTTRVTNTKKGSTWVANC